MLASDGRSTNILYNAVVRDFEIGNVIIEDSVSAVKFLKQRYKKVGLVRVVDQLFFIATINKFLSIMTTKRQAKIMISDKLYDREIPQDKITRVKSANAAETIQRIKDINPDIILVNGTRILSKKLLDSTTAKIVNIHAGITPDYRGVHGAYWAYVNKEPQMAGVTLHYVDSGVDTGNIIAQASITINSEDNFATYPLIQLSAGINLLFYFLNDFINMNTRKPALLNKGVSKQWYHPGFFEYLYHRFFNGIK